MKVYEFEYEPYCEPCRTALKLSGGFFLDSKELGADTPCHCDAGNSCLNAMKADGIVMGMFLANPLNPWGKRRIIERWKRNKTELTAFYMDYYALGRET